MSDRFYAIVGFRPDTTEYTLGFYKTLSTCEKALIKLRDSLRREGQSKIKCIPYGIRVQCSDCGPNTYAIRELRFEDSEF